MRLKDYVTESLQDKLAKQSETHGENPWLKFAWIAASDPDALTPNLTPDDKTF